MAAAAGPLLGALEGVEPALLEGGELRRAAKIVVELRGERSHGVAREVSLERLTRSPDGAGGSFESARKLAGEGARVGGASELRADLGLTRVHLVWVEDRQARELRHGVGPPAPSEPGERGLDQVAGIREGEVEGRHVLEVQHRRCVPPGEMAGATPRRDAKGRPMVAR